MKCTMIETDFFGVFQCSVCERRGGIFDDIPECSGKRPQSVNAGQATNAAQAILESQKMWGRYEVEVDPAYTQTKQKCSCSMTTLLRTGCTCGGV